ncbi:MAG: hypothetical protein DIZ77_16840 [endosymbiont of Seepiophila jonesi]|uniref:Uncharacterized protein n=1 Tax=endosymbiont of Lamellibrachia luymesi TaxID=2200907 RepID=A0A370DJ02_9GAMM|nr:MAG: hypothetical protein DIZ79_17335 [endosymbiont of Lamellibrachia luymesi]RDH88818.1 MAG: hypothetical protein DIZ77_16840 [endosymbiont of Seepiophila jonesi]
MSDSEEGLQAYGSQLASIHYGFLEPDLRKMSVWIYCRVVENRGPKRTQADKMSACVDWHM